MNIIGLLGLYNIYFVVLLVAFAVLRSLKYAYEH